MVLWMALVFSASTSLGAPHNTSRFFRPLMLWLFPHISEETLEHGHHIIRKTAHFVEYGMLGFWVWRVVQFDPAFASFAPRRKYVLAILVCMLYASTDEFHQKFVPTREPAVRDVMLDTCGSGFGLLVIWSLRKMHWSLRKAPAPA